MKHLITSITPDSIARELEITPGDFLLSVNGTKIADVFDYRYQTRGENILLEIQKPDGEIWELEIEKDEDEDVGLEFEKPLMDDAKHCRNKCVFCFIDQLPKGMRSSLYFKDDDPRLSFLSGNYVTLTNITRAEAERIAYYHLSPIRVSVHTMEPGLRIKMTGNPSAGNLRETLEIFNNAGITLHFQIVLCRGINDGENLDYTIGELLKFRPGAASLSVVPAGLTRHRDGLYPLEQFTAEEAADVILRTGIWRERCLTEFGSRFVFCADEFYLQAGLDLPEYEFYEDFLQLENGVGMAAMFKREFLNARNEFKPTEKCSIKTGIVTGRAFARTMRELTEPLGGVTVYEIENKFFGPLITVSGLLTGGDIISQIKNKITEDNIDIIFIPSNALRAGTDMMLDGVTVDYLSEKLGVPVKTGSSDGGEFYRGLISNNHS